MSQKKFYLFNLCFGMINAIAVQMLPLMLIQKQFNTGQVATVVSAVFLAALLQPLVGIVTTRYTGSKRMMQMLLVSQFVFASIMLVTYSYIGMIVATLLFSVSRVSLSPMYDSYVTNMAINHNFNYGLIRSGASLGFGIGMFVYTFIAFLFSFQYTAAFGFIALLATTAFLLMTAFPAEEHLSKDSLTTEDTVDIKRFFVLVSMYTLYFGALNLRMSYISTYYVEFGYSAFFISLAAFFMVIPEVIFLPLYNKLFASYNKMLLLAIAFFIAMIQISMYLIFTASPGILLFTSMLNGFQIMLFFPTFFPLLRESLGAKNSAFGFVINMTIQSLFVGLVNLFVIKPLYVSFDSTIPIYIAILVIVTCTFIPLAIYTIKYYKR